MQARHIDRGAWRRRPAVRRGRRDSLRRVTPVSCWRQTRTSSRLGVFDHHWEVAKDVYLVVPAKAAVDEHGAGRAEGGLPALVDSDESDLVLLAASLDRHVVSKRGRVGIGEIHVDRIFAGAAIDAQTEGPIRGEQLERVVVRETARSAEIDVDVVLPGAGRDVDVEQARQLEGMVLVDAPQGDVVVAAAAADGEVRGAAGMRGSGPIGAIDEFAAVVVNLEVGGVD